MPERRTPLRVTFLNSIDGWGGGEKWCIEAGEALREKGHEVAIGCRAGSPLARRGQAAGFPTWTTRLPGVLAERLASTSFGRFLSETRSEIVVANVGQDLRLAARAVTHQGAALVQRRGLLRPVKDDAATRKLYARVDRIIVNCAAIRDRMLEAGGAFLDPDRFVVVPNGVDTRTAPGGDRNATRARLGIPADAPVAGIVARLAPMKGHATLLDAWAQVVETLPRAHLVIAGDGDERGRLDARAAHLGIQDHVHWVGFQADPSDVYAAIDVVTLPSERDEGASNALLEAMWHGRPAVVTDCGGSREIVADGEAGRVVPIRDVAATASALTELLAGTEERAIRGQRAREIVAERFSREVVTDRLVDVLREVRPARPDA